MRIHSISVLMMIFDRKYDISSLLCLTWYGRYHLFLLHFSFPIDTLFILCWYSLFLLFLVWPHCWGPLVICYFVGRWWCLHSMWLCCLVFGDDVLPSTFGLFTDICAVLLFDSIRLLIRYSRGIAILVLPLCGICDLTFDLLLCSIPFPVICCCCWRYLLVFICCCVWLTDLGGICTMTTFHLSDMLLLFSCWLWYSIVILYCYSIVFIPSIPIPLFLFDILDDFVVIFIPHLIHCWWLVFVCCICPFQYTYIRFSVIHWCICGILSVCDRGSGIYSRYGVPHLWWLHWLLLHLEALEALIHKWLLSHTESVL